MVCSYTEAVLSSQGLLDGFFCTVYALEAQKPELLGQTKPERLVPNTISLQDTLQLPKMEVSKLTKNVCMQVIDIIYPETCQCYGFLQFHH